MSAATASSNKAKIARRVIEVLEYFDDAHREATVHTGQMPNRVWLYRRPILDYWAEHEETLGAIVTHVLIHEIGHHFGLSDDDMEAIEGVAG